MRLEDILNKTKEPNKTNIRELCIQKARVCCNAQSIYANDAKKFNLKSLF